jgi:hypothetical protein
MAVLRDIKRDQEMELERLRTENAALKAKALSRPFSMKIGQSGGMSVYMGSRYPTTLYYEAWIFLLEHKEQILTFLEENKSNMKLRD